MSGNSTTSANNIMENGKEGIVFNVNIPGQSRDEIRNKYDEWISYEEVSMNVFLNF